MESGRNVKGKVMMPSKSKGIEQRKVSATGTVTAAKEVRTPIPRRPCWKENDPVFRVFLVVGSVNSGSMSLFDATQLEGKNYVNVNK
jgi:hypothetical protein